MRFVKYLTESEFAPYGVIHEQNDLNPATLEKRFGVAPADQKTAVLDVTDHAVSAFSIHPNSWESFQPISGTTLLHVALDENHDDIFVLDRTVTIHPGIWHALVALTEHSSVRVAEKSCVILEKHPLPKDLYCVLESNA